jgi:hypothetical protein
MPAFACLRVELPPAWAERLEALHGKLEKVVESYLETRWSWPRRFEHLTDLSFLLADPRLSVAPADELGHLADELQQHLFGGAGEGQVSLLLFEGPAEAVMAFARLAHDDVVAAIAEPDLLPPGGRLTRLRPGVEPVVEAVSTAPPAPPTPPAVRPGPRYQAGVLGTYLVTREVFIADTLAAQPEGGPHHFSVIEAEGFLPPDEALFDEACFRAAAGMLTHKAGGLPLGVPVAYSHFVRAGQLHRLQQMLQLLPRDRRTQLSAQVYGAPRHMPHGVGPYLPLLEAHFGSVSLVTGDPGFEIEHLAAHSISSLVFCLREHEPHARQAAIRAFGDHAEAYRLRGVRQVLANVRTPAELELAVRHGLHIVSGPAIAGFRHEPIGGHAVPLTELPAKGE